MRFRSMSINLMAVSRVPAYCDAMGRGLLAALSGQDARLCLDRTEMHAFTPFTRTERGALMLELERMRNQGFAAIDQELELGLCSLAVPLLDERGRKIGRAHV